MATVASANAKDVLLRGVCCLLLDAVVDGLADGVLY